ncbi:GspH/FimT family pseudopilin [Gilvimarinus polysaccharolyticus]|uniref:GspH/FimT family pseudopilin n=1 Tax=Gilvimarinus polysaccharolyticus TaxID=863921 RepID=UPI0018DC0674|nr:GspH/FimT family pseudopilin [Gilvimarinus polysaccharolyticus]
MKTSGFSLIEMIITLAIGALLFTIAIPAFDHLIRSSRIETATWALFDATQTARSHAVKANSRVTMQANSTWQQGWRIFHDDNHNGLYDEDELLLQTHHELHESIKVKGNRPLQDYISYLGTGESHWASGKRKSAFQAGTITICSDNAEHGGYSLVLSRGGRIRKERIGESECATST